MAEQVKDGLEELLGQFREAQEQTITSREQAERDRDYYDGKQWTQAEIDILNARKQPVVTSNRIKPKVDSLLGFEKRQRTDPKAYPRTPQHDKDAEATTDALRYVADNNNFSQTRSAVAENLFIEGCGAAVVRVQTQRNGEREIKIDHVPWDRFYADPHSRRRDYSDAKYMGVVVWMDEADALAEFPGKEDVVSGCYAGDDDGDSFADRPKIVWSDKQRKRIRVLQHRWKDRGTWKTAIVCRGGYLRDPQDSPYMDEHGEPECDLIAVSAYVDRENNRYGVVRQMISAQDEINKRRSKALHRLSVRQVIAEHGAVADISQTKRELAKPDGYIEVNPDMRFELTDSTLLAAPELEMLLEAKAEIDISGINPSLEGNQQAPSGRAQEIQQASALSEMAVVFEALRDWSWRVYRSAWCRVRQYWTEEKWIRVTDDESNIRFVGLNHPVTAGEEVQRLQEAGEPIPPELAHMAQVIPQHVVRIENPVGEIDVDILVEDGPDTVTVQAEQFEQLVQLASSRPDAIPIQMVIEASNLRNKDRILEHLEQGGIPPEVQQQMQQMQEELQKAQESAQTDQIKAMELQIKQRELEIKAQELEVDRYRAETERIEAVRPEHTPARESGLFVG